MFFFEFIRNSPTEESVNIINYIIHLLFLQGFFANKIHTLLDGSWSIVNEVIFYLIFPLLVTRFKKIKGKIILYCLSLILSILFILIIPRVYSEYAYYGFLTHFPTFCLGMIAFDISKNKKINSLIYKYRILLNLLAMIFMVGFIKGSITLLGIHHLYSICFFIILITTLTLRSSYNVFFSRILVILGKQTYALYFTHLLLIKLWVFFSNIYLNLDLVTSLLINVFICTFVSYLISNLLFNKIDLFFVKKIKEKFKNDK